MKALLAAVACLACMPAWAGGVMLCNQFGCRSSPYFPPPIVYTPPRAVFIPNSHGCTQGIDVYPPGWDRNLPPPPGYRRNPNPCPPVRSAEQIVEDAQRRAPAPRQPAPKDAQAAEIEGDIMKFCDDHPDEPFCGKLGSYLRKHPR